MIPPVAATQVTPNRRGTRSRDAVLDAAARLMARDGFEAATVAALVKESGIPASSVYHYVGSEDGVLLAVMERGAAQFSAELPERTQRAGSAEEHLEAMVAGLVHVLGSHPDFLRLLIVFATQPPEASDGQV